MKRGEAERLVKRSTYLSGLEKSILYALLTGADNADCSLQPFTTPANTEELALWAGVSRAQLYRLLPHLERHGWLRRETWRGRGKRSAYLLVPQDPDSSCACEKVAPRDLSRAPKGLTTRQKTSHVETENVSPITSSPQVEPPSVLREAGKEGESVRPCDYCDSTDSQIFGAYRLCKTHAGSQWKEPAA